MRFFIRALFLVFIIGTPTHMMHAADTTVVNSSGLNKMAQSISRSIDDRTHRLWVDGQLKNFVKTLQTIEKRRYAFSENKQLKKEILMNASQFMQDIKNNVYNFSITKDEKITTENIVLNYQKEYVTSIRKYMEQYIKGDQRERGNMDFTLNSPEGDLSVRLISYRTTVIEDLKKIEIDGKIDITFNKKGNKDPMHIILDGNIKLLDQELYVSLRDYSVTNMIEGLPDIENNIALLKELKGKTYHKTIDQGTQRYISGDKEFNEEVIKTTYKILDILQENSLLTPVAKKGDTYVLGFNIDIIKKISKIIDSETRHDLNMLALDLNPMVSLPMNITLKNSDITIKALTPDIRFNAVFTQENSITDLKMNLDTVGDSQSSKLTLHRTPFAITANMIFNTTYFIDFSSTDNQTTATLKQLDKTLGKIRIDKYGAHAWTYDLSAMWDYEKYDWENDKNIPQNIIIKLFGNVEREFGKFTIIPPTITEEMNKLSYFENQRDKTRKQDISSIESNIEYYKSEGGAYPKTPKNGCVSAIKTPYSSISFDYFMDPQSLGTGKCTNGYLYRNMKNTYIIATRVEQKSNANFDNSQLDINTASYGEIVKNTKNTITSNNPSDWLYVITMENKENYYNYN